MEVASTKRRTVRKKNVVMLAIRNGTTLKMATGLSLTVLKVK